MDDVLELQKKNHGSIVPSFTKTLLQEAPRITHYFAIKQGSSYRQPIYKYSGCPPLGGR